MTRRLAAAAVGALVLVTVAGCTPATTNRSSSQVVVVSDGQTRSSSSRSDGARGQGAADAGRTIVITAGGDVCWKAAVDGRTRSGCGDARITDTRGAAGAVVTKTGGPTRVGVRLVVDGRTVDRGSVWRTGRAASVTA